MKELVFCSQNVWHKKSGPWEMSNWHGSPPKREVEEGLFAREFFSLPFKKKKRKESSFGNVCWKAENLDFDVEQERNYVAKSTIEVQFLVFIGVKNLI